MEQVLLFRACSIWARTCPRVEQILLFRPAPASVWSSACSGSGPCWSKTWACSVDCSGSLKMSHVPCKKAKSHVSTEPEEAQGGIKALMFHWFQNHKCKLTWHVFCADLSQNLAQAQIEPARRAGPAPHWGRPWPDKQDLVQTGPGSGSDQHQKHPHVNLHLSFETNDISTL